MSVSSLAAIDKGVAQRLSDSAQPARRVKTRGRA